MTDLSDDEKNARTAELDAAADAAAKAALDPKAKIPEGHVRVRITKAGHGKVSTGGSPRRQTRSSGAAVFVGESLDPRFCSGDTPILPRDIAQELEARFYVEIQD
ncbi:MAG: hypothetical protein ACYDD1_04950 [Caulobacteraceae bacterium]